MSYLSNNLRFQSHLLAIHPPPPPREVMEVNQQSAYPVDASINI
ncbi:hypothetical protein NOC27_1552 [Nitrosococcus oceani AFC27]|nr:hypothetical protein NOC27_1552 [Nitrosococcus oceani AFC27]